MNHDFTHCLDYQKDKCPKKCFRAELTEDLKHRPDLWGLFFSWANFLGEKECPRHINNMEGETI